MLSTLRKVTYLIRIRFTISLIPDLEVNGLHLCTSWVSKRGLLQHCAPTPPSSFLFPSLPLLLPFQFSFLMSLLLLPRLWIYGLMSGCLWGAWAGLPQGLQGSVCAYTISLCESCIYATVLPGAYDTLQESSFICCPLLGGSFTAKRQGQEEPKPSSGALKNRRPEGRGDVYTCVRLCVPVGGGFPSPDLPKPGPHLCTREGPFAPKPPHCPPRHG